MCYIVVKTTQRTLAMLATGGVNIQMHHKSQIAAHGATEEPQERHQALLFAEN
jgi:hypothetical protein